MTARDTTPTDVEVELIARALTKAQRLVVVQGHGNRRDAATVFAIEPSLFNVWNAETEEVRLSGVTSIGLAVRQYLTREDGTRSTGGGR